MKITDIRIARISVPLRVPFKTALRTVNSVEDIIVEIHTDTGHVGYGEAPPPAPSSARCATTSSPSSSGRKSTPLSR